MQAAPVPAVVPATEPVHPVIQTMYDLVGKMGFRMLGAQYLLYDNRALSLQWRMGSGSSIGWVYWRYEPETDTYAFTFQPWIGEVVQFEQVYVEDVLDLIEQQTGFYVTLNARR